MQLWSNYFTLSKYDTISKRDTSHAVISHQGELPYIELKKDSETTNIKPSEIRLSARLSIMNPYVNSLLPFEKSKTDYSMELNYLSIKSGKFPFSRLGDDAISDDRGLFSEMTSRYLKVPFIEVFGGEPPADSLKICGSKETEGAMFVTGVYGKGYRRLSMCADGKARGIAYWD